MQESIAKRLEGIRRTLREQGGAGRDLSTASKGREREVFVTQFLGQVFPHQFRVGSGDITDSAGGRSGQVDLVIELPFFPSFPVPGGGPRLYMAEGVGAVIEVKSDLRKEWDDVERTTAAVKRLNPKRIRTLWIGKDLPKTLPVLAVGFIGYKTIDGLVERMQNTSPEHCPNAALVIDDPGLFVADEGNQTLLAAEGPEALFWFLAHLNWYLTKLVTAGFSGMAYDPVPDRTR